MTRSLARMLVVAALACFGLLGLAAMAFAEENVVQGSNSSLDAETASGETTGVNESAFTGGPTALADTSSQATQNGRNTGTAKQSGKAKSGDSVAGGQVTGAVADDVTVQNQNTAVDPLSETGVSELENFAEFTLGPLASGSSASQLGDNVLDIIQEADASTGDAVAGSQVTGIVGEGEHTVQVQNSIDCGGDCALSGDSLNVNDLEALIGPVAEDDTAQAAQVGDNDAAIEQSSITRTGDALSGAQVTGSVGGSAAVQGQNNSTCDGPCATSGTAGEDGGVTNAAVLTAGPRTDSDVSQSTQNGDNALDVTQNDDAASGDAISGSQVTGLVSEEQGHLSVQNQQASDGDIAETGQAFAANELEADAGPDALGADSAQASQNGDNAVKIDQTVGAITGDAVAGSQVTGAVAGDHAVVEVQNQNHAGTADEGAIALSGNALAAAQVTGVVTGSGSTTDIQLANDATGDDSTGAFSDFSLATNAAEVTAGTSGEADDVAEAGQVGDNVIDISQVGNDGALAVLQAAPTAFADVASASQNGDDAVTASQENVSASGDAVAGSQVTGAVSGSGSDTDVQATNTSIDAFATSGLDEGPVIAIPNVLEVAAGPVAEGDTSASASQIGDAMADLAQSADAGSGDAVAGSQVTGVVSPEEVDVQVLNASEGDIALSGDVSATNEVEGTLGPEAFADVASASHNGDTGHTLGQDVITATGDAVGGGQVTGKAG